MKKLLLTTLGLIGFVLNIHAEPIKLDLTKTINHTASKVALYEATMVWIAYTFVSAKSVIQYEDKEAGRIVGKYYMSDVPITWYEQRPASCASIFAYGNIGGDSVSHIVPIDLFCVLDISIKDNMVVIRISNGGYINDNENISINTKVIPKYFENEVNNLVDDLTLTIDQEIKNK